MAGNWDRDPANDIGIRDDLAHLTFGEQIRKRRDEVGISQGVAADFARVSRGTLKNAEAGKPLSDKTTVNIEQALGWIGRSAAALEGGEAPPRQVLAARTIRPIAAAFTSDMVQPDDTVRRSYINDYHKLIEALAESPPQLPTIFGRLMLLLRSATLPNDVQSLMRDLGAHGFEPAGVEAELERMKLATRRHWTSGNHDAVGDLQRRRREEYERRVKEEAAWVSGFGSLWAWEIQDDEQRREAAAGLARRVPAELVAGIMNSGLGRRLQNGLLMYLSRRMSNFEKELSDEFDAIVTYLQKTADEEKVTMRFDEASQDDDQ